MTEQRQINGGILSMKGSFQLGSDFDEHYTIHTHDFEIDRIIDDLGYLKVAAFVRPMKITQARVKTSGGMYTEVWFTTWRQPNHPDADFVRVL